MLEKQPEIIYEYHVHVYFQEGQGSAEQAKRLRSEIEKRFGKNVEIGRWHKDPVGPHPKGSYQVKFTPEYFKDIVQWLSLNSRGLSILIHPETGDELSDHKDHPLWIGKQLPLNLSIFKQEPKPNVAGNKKPPQP